MKRMAAALAAMMLLLTGCMTMPSVTQNNTSTPFTEDCIYVDTPYGSLAYPQKWQEQVRFETNDTPAGYCVMGYGSVEGHPEHVLFELWFGGENGEIDMGSLQTEAGETVRVAVTFCELAFDNSWTTEQQDTLCAMQEDVNYMLNELNLF